jgi:hypothetical protein
MVSYVHVGYCLRNPKLTHHQFALPCIDSPNQPSPLPMCIDYGSHVHTKHAQSDLSSRGRCKSDDVCGSEHWYCGGSWWWLNSGCKLVRYLRVVTGDSCPRDRGLAPGRATPRCAVSACRTSLKPCFSTCGPPLGTTAHRKTGICRHRHLRTTGAWIPARHTRPASHTPRLAHATPYRYDAAFTRSLSVPHFLNSGEKPRPLNTAPAPLSNSVAPYPLCPIVSWASAKRVCSQESSCRHPAIGG